MKLQTQIPLEKQEPTIGYNSKLVLLGSCFAENMAEKLSYYKFQNEVNPLGVLFHPVAILDLLTRAHQNTPYNERDVFFSNGCWQSFRAHSRLNSTSQAEILERLNTALKLTQNQLQNASHVIITFGTAWVYEHIESKTTVANCHKQPQKEFKKSILSVDQLQETFESICSVLKSFNPEVSVVFSISPVRHLKDGFVENNQSKAHLMAALHAVINTTENTHYFPSYELLMDELRDYRFYKEDMVHPNPIAINYIWKKFQSIWINTEVNPIMQEVNQLQKGFAHKPFNPLATEHTLFLSALAKKAQALESQFPFMKF
ncbi:GSCFA domain-containing protein [Flavobacteriaceae bacterium]|nr:GSCFA domain-containing protein [Flavobacteriaceae bacterium]MDB9954146.1 GSCFA domain-containing protein [Flavobacteriaceae bacterium]